MKATKGNKIYTITEAEKDFYVKQGFDILDDKGNIIEHGAGKQIKVEEYETLKIEKEKLEKENKKLKEEIKELKKGAQ
ncbi:hypothetical protein [Clostridium sp.]|uniref:hypothetical protein n=1 Tax=Clostridium sp. TaxID=1506 RepID=UPI00261615F0|nr:hypothetical protein [Clostridium sp.]